MLRTLACLVSLLMLTTTAHAEKTRDVLKLYGNKVSYEDEIKKSEYVAAVEKYEILEKEVNYLNQFNANVQEVNIESVYKARADMELRLRELTSSLCSGVNLSVDNIFAAETEIKRLEEALRRIDDSLFYYKSLYTYEIPIDKVQSALAEVVIKEVEYSEAVKYGEIGNVSNVKVPLDGSYYISSHYGARIDPLDGVSMDNHRGTDFAANTDTPVLALFAGTVTVAEEHYGMGKYVRINHGDGIVSTYLHLNYIDVEVGDQVDQYTVIGGVGTTGLWSTGPHLHLALSINGEFVDPYDLWR